MEGLIIFGYGFALTMICLYSLIQLNLIRQYQKTTSQDNSERELRHFPRVTVQLPVYNERYVVSRLIDAVCNIDYPKDKFEVQVLDDSDDDTKEIILAKINEWKREGITISRVTRDSRTGFKAGALQYGLSKVNSEFIAIFDADFIPPRNFLKATLPHFKDDIGMVQTRWGHLNENYNILTQMQAFGLNAHFTVEQSGRQNGGRLINFNGTAGIWRRECIEKTGGWHHDTLTEDLDLSYRAQLKGWKFKYLENVVSPAELPVLVPAIKAQQYRWNKGAAETARKQIKHILKSDLPLWSKVHGITHLLNSSLFLWLFIAAITSVPLILIRAEGTYWFWNWGTLFIFGFIVIIYFYWTSFKASNPKATLRKYLQQLPLFLTYSGGMSLHNSIAVIEGYFGVKTPFIRTPKFNILAKGDTWKGNKYFSWKISYITILEGILMLYFLFGIALSFIVQDFGFILWHLMLAIGFGLVFFRSVKPLRYA